MTSTGRLRREDERQDDLRIVTGVLWQNLPVVVVSTLLCTLTLIPGFALSPGFTPLGVVSAFVFGSPAWAATIAATDRIASGDEVTIGEYLGRIRPLAVPAWRTAVVPTALMTSSLVSSMTYEATDEKLFLVCAIVTGGAAVVVAFASTQVFSLRTATHLTGRHLWYLASVLALSRPMLTLGVAAFAVLGLLASVNWSASALILIPGPLALLCSVVSRAALRDTRRVLDGVPGPAMLRSPVTNLDQDNHAED